MNQYKIRELKEYIDIECLPYQIGLQGEFTHINSTHHPFEEKFLDKLNAFGLKIKTITHLKEIGQTLTCIDSTTKGRERQ